MNLDPEALFYELGHLVAATPDLCAEALPSETTIRWFAKTHALLSETMGDKPGSERLGTTMVNWQYGSPPGAAGQLEITWIVNRALAVAELRAPISARGAFLPVGSSFDALGAVGKVLRTATRSILIVDPYLDAKAVEDFVPQAPENLLVRLLADEAHLKPSLRPAVTRWTAQHGRVRPIEARLTPPRTLHDRLIAIDDQVVWSLSQSLKDLAERSPAIVVRIDPEIAALKLPFYQEQWSRAAPL